MSTLEQAFDPESFRTLGHQIIDRLADHLATAKKGNLPVISFKSPDQELSYWENFQADSTEELVQAVINRSIHVHHPKYIGHQVAAPAPVAALAGLVSEFLNTGMGIYEMGSPGTAIERVVTKLFCQRVGYDNNADGFLTSGGTLANLTALLGARAKFKQRHPELSPHILVSDQAHFCIDRAATTMGFSVDQIIKIKSDDDYKICIDSLEQELTALKKSGQGIMCIVGCACSTSTGTYDNLSRLAQICQREDIWFHVDGAHGGAAIFSEKYKYLCSGMEHADSVIIDAHKMMMTPALATSVLFKNYLDSYNTFSTEASYLFEQQDDEWYTLAKRTYETTKYMMSLKIYSLYKTYGLDVFDEFVTRQYNLARTMENLIEDHPKLELGHTATSNILCFRYITKDAEVASITNKEIRSQLLQEGKFYIVQTTLNNELYLRITIMSPYTSKDELNELIQHVVNIGEGLN